MNLDFSPDMFGIGAANNFKAKTAEAKADGRISQDEFKDLHADYRALPNLSKYAVRSWLAGEHPELADTVTDPSMANGWQNLQAVTRK